MVEIREETDEQQPASGENHQQSMQPNGTTGNGNRRKSPMDFIKENPNEMLSFGLRLATIYFAISYFLPIAIPLQRMAYTKAFAAAAATNAFRLHQRLSSWSRTENVPVFSQRFLFELMIEDSAHYFFYCVILIMSTPITLALLPISLYAIFNIINFVNKFSNEVGYISPSIANSIYQIKQQHSASMLCTIACAEIFLFPILIIMIFFGKANLFTPFVYYRFLTMRYLSRRNPYTREMFTQLKYLFYSVANKPTCPFFLKTLIFKSISFIQRLAPQQVPI